VLKNGVSVRKLPNMLCRQIGHDTIDGASLDASARLSRNHSLAALRAPGDPVLPLPGAPSAVIPLLPGTAIISGQTQHDKTQQYTILIWE
jgi:hypothetical protein